MSFLRGRLASTEGAFFLQQSKNAVAKLAEKQPPPHSSAAEVGRRSPSPPELGEEVLPDVLPEILRHSLPSAVFRPPAESSLSASSVWALPETYGKAGFVSADAKNPLRAFVSLPQVTFGPKRWELPTVETSITASTANERRRDRYPPIDSEKVKAAAEGLAHAKNNSLFAYKQYWKSVCGCYHACIWWCCVGFRHHCFQVRAAKG